MAKRKYNYFHVAIPYNAEVFGSYIDALRFYGKAEKPSTLYGVHDEEDGYFDNFICIKSK